MGVFSGFSSSGQARSSAFALLLSSFYSSLYVMIYEIPSVLGCLIGSFLWLKFESFIILMEACGACVLEPSKMDPYAMSLFFALIISTGEIYAFCAQFYGRREIRDGLVCVHGLKEKKMLI
uniref:Uncharacterized protein n=1 Tax=Micrurus paraensis TaxID=1970185 RepID=A0A2D4KRN7_9SAUR